MGCLLLALGISAVLRTPPAHAGTFTIAEDRFKLNDAPARLISGDFHYFRLHPEQWEERLMRVRAMGLNAISTYVPWNLHEPSPGVYNFRGIADVERFLQLAHKLGLWVLLRPGPYICAEWDGGGLPAWLASSQVAGGGVMKRRSADEQYLGHVDRWFAVLLARIKPLTIQQGGPIVMLQVENELGFYYRPDEAYLRHLKDTIQASLGKDLLLYTTDPPKLIQKGSLREEIFAAVDFGPKWFKLDEAFEELQKGRNKKGGSPALNSEYYTGWLNWWGEPIANNSATKLVEGFVDILSYANNTGSVNLYMAAGGTTFGFWAGAQVNGQDQKVAWEKGEAAGRETYQSIMTSYDYQSPISESGDYGQPGTGGDVNKYDKLREAIANATGVTPPKKLPPPAVAKYGTVNLVQSAPLTAQLAHWFPGGLGLAADQPLPMEEYGQQRGLIMYTTFLPNTTGLAGSSIHFQGPVHDEAQVLINNRLAGRLSRSGNTTVFVPSNFNLTKLILPGPASGSESPSMNRLDVIVEGVGRKNTGKDWDTKGLSHPDVLLNGEVLKGWQVFPLPLDSIEELCFPQPYEALTVPSPSCPLLLPTVNEACNFTAASANATYDPAIHGPTFFRGNFYVDPALKVDSLSGGKPIYPDTYLDFTGANFTFGLVWVNGFNLGYYWPAKGPQMTSYVPGPLLRCLNEVVVLELDRAASPAHPTVSFTTVPNFSGPSKSGAPASAPGGQGAPTAEGAQSAVAAAGALAAAAG